MYKGHLISADFEENTMEFEIEHEFTVKAGKYIILSEEEYKLLSYICNNNNNLNG